MAQELMRVATAYAPASVGNIAVGFDILGHSLEGAGDRATVRSVPGKGVRILGITGVVTELPKVAAQNTAGRALEALLAHHPVGHGFEVSLEKGIALGSGMGGSAASAVAALVAANALLPTPLSLAELYHLAMEGEAAASGAKHGDNVAPQLLGGMVIAPVEGAPVSVPVPPEWHIALVHPHFVLETRVARAALAGPYELHDFVQQSERLSLVLAGCFRGDARLVKRGLEDVLVEPRRARLIPGFAAVKRAALEAGAMGASISGAGPSCFGWFTTREAAYVGAVAMATAFQDVGLESDRLVSKVAGPAARVESCSP